MHVLRGFLALTLLSAMSASAAANVVAVKRSGTTVYAGPNISSVFQNAITGGTIVLYTDASTGQDMVDDTALYGANSTTQYQNWGVATTAISGNPALYKFKVSQLPGFAGGRINKAELQLYFTAGNSNPPVGQVISQDWFEGNKSGGYPGAAPALAGASWAHPRGLNTGSDQAADGTPSAGAGSWGIAGNAKFNSGSDVSGVTFGGVYGFNYGGTPFSGDGTFDGTAKFDVTQVAQAWADGTANYGFHLSVGNIGFVFTEAGGDYQPVLFIDYTPNDVPTTIGDLAAGAADWYKVDLTWTAPSDVPTGPVHHYEVRYSTSAINAGNWSSATLASNPPTPANPGGAQAFTVTGLSANTTYYFAVKSFDATGLVSALSNVVSKLTGPPDGTAPAAIGNLAVSDTRPNSVTVTWTSPGDDNSTGTAYAYDLRYSTSTITAGNFNSAIQVGGVPAPLAAGNLQSMKVTGLNASTTYYFAIKARDEVPNWAGISNVVSSTTLAADVQAPNAITDLGIGSTGIKTASLHWTTPADNGTAGLASYEVRYSTSAITAGNWSSATVAANPPAPTAAGDPVNMMITGLSANTTYYFAVKSTDQAMPANTSAISNVPSGTTQPPIQPVVVHNPWLKNDRVADTHNITTMGQTYINAYTPNGVVTPTTNDDKAINIYNNQKRRLYHWAVEPPSLSGYNIEDPTYLQNIFGWCLCGRHARNACTILNAAGITPHLMSISNPWGHWTYQAEYDGATHAFDTMCTHYVWNRANPPKIAGCAEQGADSTLLLNAVAEGRACPGLLLCGDSITEYQQAMANAGDGGPGSGVVAANWTGNMDLRVGQSFKRTWESWLNQHPPTGGMTPPYHHEANKDWKDTVNFPYWEPYQLTTAESTAINVSYTPTFRRWANGTDVLAPDFRSAGYQSMVHSSTNIRTYNDDQQSPDLHVAAVDTLAEVVFRIYLPFYVTDASVSGTFYRHDTGDVNKILVSTDGNYYTQVWDNQASGTTNLNALNLRNWVFGGMTYYVKVQLQANGAITDAGVSNLVIQTTFEHNKGAMAYLDKGTNNLTFTFDNPAELAGSSTTVHIVYKWKEYDGANWTVDRSYETYTTTSPHNFTINVAGTKVPRTEYVLVELIPTPSPDGTAPMPITNLTVSLGGSNCVDLTWTSPGDDWDEGTASSYDLRYSTSLITAGNWGSATQVTGEPSPKAGGQTEAIQVTGLNPNTTYYFAIKTSDEVPNTSGLSNVASVTTDPADSTAPAAISNLAAAAGGTAGTINLTWTAPGDDGNTGTARTYDIRYSTSPITAGNFAGATAASNPPTPKAAGQSESFMLTGVPTGVMYYFAIKTIDEVPNTSAISNVASAKSILGDQWFQNGLNGCTCCSDSYMSKAAETTNYDGLDYMIVAGFSDQASTNRRRSILKFNLSELVPANAVITQAKVYVYAYSNEQHDPAGGYYALNRVTTAWSAPTVTWNMPWTVSGGADIEATPDARASKQTTTGVWYEFDVTSRVQDFIANPGNNNGWVLKCDTETNHNQDYFVTSESADMTHRPKLFITDVGSVITTLASPSNGGTVSGGGTFQAGQTCTLTATGTGQFVFDHWSGGPVDGSTSNPVGFTVSNSATITAVFTSTDSTAPAAVANLAAAAGGTSGTINLTWTAPGDDGSTGTAYAYDVRYSTSSINDGNFASATAVAGIGAPKAAGQAEAYTVSGLTNGTTYYFAVKTRDEVPNTSALSNVASAAPTMGDRTFQNGVGGYTGGKDSYMSAGAATTNYGTNTRMSVSGYADQGPTNPARGIVKFDLTSISAGTNITRATLYLYAYDAAAVRGSTGYYGAYALTRDWTDTTVTWNTYNGTNAWTAAGGDFNATADAQSAKQGVAGVWYAFDVTSRVQTWINSPSSNYGWVIKCTDENLHNQDNFYQADYATDPTLRPKLIVSDQSGFTVSTTSSPTAGGTVSGGGNYQSGQTCTLTANPATGYGYSFVRWSGGPVDNQTTNPVSFTVSGDVTVTAVFQGPAGYIDVTNYSELKTAIQTTAVAGNTIRVHPGTYTMPVNENRLQLNNQGASGQPITVIGVGGSKPILTTTGQNMDRGFFYINPTNSYWTFDNLEFQNIHDGVGANAAAAYILGDNITFRNCKIHDCDQGFASTTDSSNGLIEYCEIYNCNTSVNPGYAHLMYMMSDSLTVRGCYLHNAVYGQCFKSRCTNLTFEYNWCETDGSEGFVAGQASGNANNSLFRGNVFIKRSAAGGQRGIFYVYDTSGSISGTVSLLNNTFISTQSNDIYVVHNTGSTANVVLKNNIFAGSSDTLLTWNVAYSQLSGNNNVVKPAMTVPSQLTGSITTSDPGFVNLATRDLHLLSNSACVNVGQNNPTYMNAAGSWVDGTPVNEPGKTLTLVTRVAAGTLDCGAHEYHPPVPDVAFNSATSSGSENVTSVSLPVSLSQSYSGTVTVEYAVTGGTATGGGTDYTLAAGTLTFTTGVTTQNIPVTVVNDTTDENDETIVVTLSNPTNATLGTNTAHTYTITDEDNAPNVQFAATSSSGLESVTAVNLTVNLSAASGKTVTVSYAASGTATATDDYTLGGTSLTFNAGETSKTIPLTIVDDAAVESDETVIVTLSGPVNATLGGNTAHTYTIQDNEMPVAGFQVTSSSGGEATTPANLVVTLNRSSSQTVTVDYDVTGGSATQGSDFTLPGGGGGQQVIALKRDAGLLAGGALDSRFTALTGANVVLATVKDAAIFPSGNTAEYYNFGTSTICGGYYGASTPIIGWDLSAYSGGTVNKAQLRIHCTGGNTGVWYAGIKTWDWAEGNKDSGLPGAAPAAPGACWKHPNGTYTSASGPAGWGAAGNANFDETANTGDVYDHVNFTSVPAGTAYIVADVTTLVQDWLSGTKPNYGLYIAQGNHSMHLSEIGSDNQPVLYLDVTMPVRQVSFAPGETSKSVPLTIVDDSSIESDETVQVTLTNPSNAVLGTNTVHTYTITDNDIPAVTVQFQAAASSDSEATTSVNLPVTLSASSSQTITVNYAVTGGTATGSGTDYTLASGQLTFVPGDTSENIPVTVNNDAIDEVNETIVVTLSSPTNANLGTPASHTYTIEDEDAAPTVEFAAAASSGAESVTSVNLTVTLTGQTSQTVTVNYAVSGGSATSPADYTISGTSLTFNPGDTSKTVPITVVDDTTSESDETIEVTLSSPTNATLGTNAVYTYTITDNDIVIPVAQFSVTSGSGGEGTTPANLVVTLSQATTVTVTVDYNVTGGTATQFSDYTLPPGGSQVIALKRDAGLVQGGALDSRFTGLTGANVVLATVKDAEIWSPGMAGLQNFGTTPLLSGFSGGPNAVAAWDLSSYAGGTVNLAQMRFHCTAGNTGMWWAGIRTHDWPEGNKNGAYPGLDPAAPGVTWTNPNAINSTGTDTPGWGDASNASFSETDDCYTHYNFTSVPAGDAFCIADLTAIAQDWLSGTKPNYGVYVWFGNHGLHMSEIGSDNQPVLFLDVTLPQRHVTFAPGETSKVIPITIINDTATEANETIQVTLSNPNNATLGGNTVHTYTINDDDVVIPTVQFQAGSSSGGEATTAVDLPVTLSASSSQTVTVQYAVTGGTATGSGTDYTLAAGTLTFDPTVTSQNIPVTINNDGLDETDETIIVTLSSPSNATLGATTAHTYTITDNDDTPTVAFSTTTSSGSEATASVNLAVTLSAASGQTVTVNYASTGGTATGGGTDYTLSGTSLTFNPGETSKNVPITVVNDSAPESNETIVVAVSSPVNATLGTNTTHTYTINDNDAPAVTFVAAGAVASNAGAITPALPAGLQANDILLLFVETANQACSITNQNGGTWTAVTGSPQGTGTAGGTAATRLTAFWSRYNGTQGAPTVGDSGDHQLGRMIAIRGATTSGDPWDVTAGGVEATSDTSGSIPGASTTVANTLVVVAIATSLPDASSTARFSGWTNADLSSLTERTDNTVTAGNGGGLAIATGGKATAGAYGATAVTLVNAAQKGMMSIAIKP